MDNDGVRALEFGVKVYQRSATVGRGAPGIAVLSIPASSNIVTCGLPKTASSLVSALMARLLVAYCSLLSLM